MEWKKPAVNEAEKPMDAVLPFTVGAASEAEVEEPDDPIEAPTVIDAEIVDENTI